MDFLLDGFDLAVADGDLALNASAAQLLNTAAYSYPGEWIFAPWLGVGVNSFILGDERDVNSLLRLVRLNLKAMGISGSVDAVVRDGNFVISDNVKM